MITKNEALERIKELESYIQQLDSKPTIESKIEEIGNTIRGRKILVSENREYVMVPLPSLNPSWTFAAFDWVKEFCKKNSNTCPVHYVGHDNHNWLYIQVRSADWR